MEYPQHLNMSKINKAFRKQELQKYGCIIEDFEEFKKFAKKDYVTFFVSFFSNLVSNSHIRSDIKQLFKKFGYKASFSGCYWKQRAWALCFFDTIICS